MCSGTKITRGLRSLLMILSHLNLCTGASHPQQAQQKCRQGGNSQDAHWIRSWMILGVQKIWKIKIQGKKNPNLSLETAVCLSSSFLMGPWARMAGRWSYRQDDSSWTLIQSHHARKMLLHALSSSSATLHFRCRDMVYNLIPKHKGLASIFYALLSSCLDFYDSTYIRGVFCCVQPSDSNIK